MGLKDNLHYWQLSLDHPETLGEVTYSHDEVIIEDEQFRLSVDGLRGLLRAYCAFRNSCTKEGKSSCTTETMNSIVKIIDMVLRRTKNVQHTEFVAYWKCLDLSYSVYKKLDDSKRMEQLRVALDRYCEKRLDLYDQLGLTLTHVISQALYDVTSSRTMSKSGVRKLECLLEKVEKESKKKVVEVKNLDEFLSTQEPCRFLPRGESLGELMKKLDAKFSFGKAHQGKIPDLVVKIHDFVFVIEAKHIKEPGGAQDKQIRELIDFVSQTEHESCPVRYVAFLDGPYSNLLAKAKQVARGNEIQTEKNEIKSKLNEQLESIEDALNKHKRSYFVNTEGMLRLLMDALNSDTSTEEGF